MDAIDYGELKETLRELKKDLAIIRSMNASTSRATREEPIVTTKASDSVETTVAPEGLTNAPTSGGNASTDDEGRRSAVKPECRDMIIGSNPTVSGGSATEIRLPGIEQKSQVPILSRGPLTLPTGQHIVVNAACDPTAATSTARSEPVTMLDVNRKMFVAALNKLDS